jgi:hypothetical protein
LVNVKVGKLKGGTPPVPVESRSSELAESELTWSEDTGLASNVEVANVELSMLDMLEVNDDSNGVPDRPGMSEPSTVGRGEAVSAVVVAVELSPKAGPACLRILSPCVRRHGRFRRGPASTAAMSDRACNISVVVRIFAEFEYGVLVKIEQGKRVKIGVKGPPKKRTQVK